jgi:Ca2+-binding RTX toxin-like protein
MPILRSQIAYPRTPVSRPDDEILIAEEQTGIVVSGRPPLFPVIHGTEAADKLVGTDRNEFIYGYGSGDEIDGGKGADKMYGGEGDDEYYVDDAGDVVSENAGEGKDTVNSSIDYELGANVENLDLTGNAVKGTGNELNIDIMGNGQDNILSGGDGQDDIDGGTGADFMIGGDGNDGYSVDDAGDIIWELKDQGFDTVWSSVSYTLYPNLEMLRLNEWGGAIDGTGNDDDNVIFGNSSKNILKGGLGDDTLDGEGGNDEMYGGEGDDTFYVDSINDLVVEHNNQGFDTVSATSTFFLSNNAEKLVLKEEGGAINGYGNDDDNYLYGNSFANNLGGYNGIDYIKAAGGKDKVDGGYGDDHLWGGSDNDTFRFHGDFGHDMIHDFKAGGDLDIIELDHNQFADFAAVQAAMVANIGSVSIVLDANNTIHLSGVNAADLTASDFQFV